jgi:hypothetical protein
MAKDKKTKDTDKTPGDLRKELGQQSREFRKWAKR